MSEKTSEAPPVVDDIPWISGPDLGLMAGLPFLALISWLTPEAVWRGLGRGVAPLAGGLLSRGPGALIQRIQELAGDQPLPVGPSEIARQLVAHEIETAFQFARCHAPIAWRPEIELVGRAHLDAALATGNGAIVWASHFYFSSLITKMALHREGYPVHHLSRPDHGFSGTRLGVRFLNPVQTSVERRYLATRVVMDPSAPGEALGVLAERLQENGIVSITVRGAARRPIDAPFLAGRYSIAPGAPYLAAKTGAALLPTHTVRLTDGHYRVTLEPPIDVDGTAAIEAAGQDYARRLEPHVLRDPGQWIDWINI
jgi:lauroyl/myristoyl acyltransferase